MTSRGPFLALRPARGTSTICSDGQTLSGSSPWALAPWESSAKTGPHLGTAHTAVSAQAARRMFFLARYFLEVVEVCPRMPRNAPCYKVITKSLESYETCMSTHTSMCMSRQRGDMWGGGGRFLEAGGFREHVQVPRHPRDQAPVLGLHRPCRGPDGKQPGARGPPSSPAPATLKGVATKSTWIKSGCSPTPCRS